MTSSITKRPSRFGRPRSSRNLFIVAAALLALLALWPRIVVTVPPGHVGVLWLRFFGGPLRNFYFGEGTKLILPWDKVFIYDARLRRLDREVKVLTADGLKVDVDFTLTYFIDKGIAAHIQESFGPDYERLLVDPVVVSQLALFVTDNGVERMYSMSRADIETAVLNSMQSKLTSVSQMRGAPRSAVRLVDINMLQVTLPAAFRDAVDLKMSSQQDIRRAQFQVERQRLINEQKILEAQGTQAVQSIITQGLTDPYLRWESIRVAAQLALSPNARTIVLGAGSAGVPLVMGVGDGPAQQSPPRTPALEPPTRP